MAQAHTGGQIIPFPEPQQVALVSFRRDSIKRDLNRHFERSLDNYNNLEIIGGSSSVEPILAPLILGKEDLREDTTYAKIYSQFATSNLPGIHEVKIVGTDLVDLFAIEIIEPRSNRSLTTLADLRQIAERRLEAFREFNALDLLLPDPARVLTIITNLPYSKEPGQEIETIRIRVITSGRSPSSPPRCPTLDLSFKGPSTEVIYDHYPYPPSTRRYRAETKEAFGGVRGRTLIANMITTFLAGEPENAQLALDLSEDFTQVEG